MTSKPDISANRFKTFCFSFTEAKKLSTKDSEIGLQEYKNFWKDIVFVSTEYKSYDRTEIRLDKILVGHGDFMKKMRL